MAPCDFWLGCYRREIDRNLLPPTPWRPLQRLTPLSDVLNLLRLEQMLSPSPFAHLCGSGEVSGMSRLECALQIAQGCYTLWKSYDRQSLTSHTAVGDAKSQLVTLW
jgi:hypothetical protein